MEITIRSIILVAMVLLTIVSMWTTYVSLHDSVLPEPAVNVPLGGERVWACSVFALALSVAIGLMLFALKLAIIDEQKRLNVLGVIGLIIIAFISISFNMDVLYRTADRDFFLRYSNSRMRSVYEEYLADAQAALAQKRDTIRREIAAQQGELEAEIEGLREAPAGYGPLAKREDYRLTVMEKTSEVDLKAVEEALVIKEQADELLRTRTPESIDEVQALQDDLRVVIKDVGARAGVPLPEPVRLENPLFAVFQKLFDFKTVGIKEIFFLLLAILLDLGDIVGYSLVPNKPKSKARLAVLDAGADDVAGPEFITSLGRKHIEESAEMPQIEGPGADADEDLAPGGRQRGAGPPRAIRFRRRR